jgi:hypothetical protein
MWCLLCLRIHASLPDIMRHVIATKIGPACHRRWDVMGPFCLSVIVRLMGDRCCVLYLRVCVASFILRYTFRATSRHPDMVGAIGIGQTSWHPMHGETSRQRTTLMDPWGWELYCYTRYITPYSTSSILGYAWLRTSHLCELFPPLSA